MAVRSKQRDPNPKDNSLIRKETSTYKGFHSTFAAWSSYQGVVVRLRVPLFATQAFLQRLMGLQAVKGEISATTQTSLDLVKKTWRLRDSWGGVVFYIGCFTRNERFRGCLRSHATIPLLKGRSEAAAQPPPRRGKEKQLDMTISYKEHNVK